jgi:GTP pyrophosphokinase
LKSGDSVEVLTSKTQTPSKDWLKITKTGRAQSRIKQWLHKIEREKNRELGQEVFEKSLRIFSSSIKNLVKSGDITKIINELKIKSEDEFFISIGSGKLQTKQILRTIPSLKDKLEEENFDDKIEEINSFSKRLTKSVKKKSNKDNAIIVDGMDDLMVRIAKCCNPIPGDPIIGFVTRGRGITVHMKKCSDIENFSADRRIPVDWNEEFKFRHPVNIKVIAHDKPGILSQISKSINNIGLNIRSAMAKSLLDKKGSFIFEIEVKDYSELLRVINCIEALSEVISVHRI